MNEITLLASPCSHEEILLQERTRERERVRKVIQERQSRADHLERAGRYIQAGELRKSARILAVLWEIAE